MSKIVLIDGCFDPLHEGHIAYIQAASRLGSHLVLNMATDEEIWIKRPQTGPLLPFHSRKVVLEALRAVQEVVCWDTKEALKKVKPAIYAKGMDWKGKLPQEELSICNEFGIEVVYLDTVLNSSSKLLQSYNEQKGKQ